MFSWIPRKSSPPAGPFKASIVAYRYNDELVYIPTPTTYDKALATAPAEFPELNACVSERISFWIAATVNGKKEKVRISSSAWDKMALEFVQSEIFEIAVLEGLHPSLRPVIIDTEVPPAYNTSKRLRNAFLIDNMYSLDNSPSHLHAHTSPPSNIVRRATNWIKNEVNH